MALPGKYIEELTELTVLDGAEEVPASKMGTTEDYKFTLTQFKKWFLSLIGLSFKENVTFEKSIISTQTTGTAPLTIASTTKVINLQADSVDGIGIALATAGYIPVVLGVNYTDSVIHQSLNNIGIGLISSLTRQLNIANTLQIRSSIGTGASFLEMSNSSASTDPLWIGKNNDAGNAILSGFPYSAIISSRGTAPFIIAVNNAVVMTFINGGNVGVGVTAPSEKIESSDGIRANGNFKKNAFFVTKNLAASANITGATAVNIQMNASTDYEYVISPGITATLNFNDASFQYDSITMVYATGGTALKLTCPGVTFYQNGVALVSDTVVGYDGTKLNEIGIKVLSSTRFLVVRG